MNNLNEITSAWGKNEFLAFLLFHIANADLELREEEMMFIENLLDEKQFKTIRKIWSKCNDFECLNVIRELRNKFYEGEEGKETLLVEMKALAGSDDTLSPIEAAMIMSLKKLL
jgi:uncharacterized tellurite resistance protein B-like protein